MDHLKPIDKTSNDEQEDIPYAQDLVMSSGNAIPDISESAPVPLKMLLSPYSLLLRIRLLLILPLMNFLHPLKNIHMIHTLHYLL